MPIIPTLQTLYPGDDLSVLAQFRNPDGSTTDYSTATIEALIIDDQGYALTGAVAQNSGAAGAAWATGLINVQIPASESSKLDYLAINSRCSIEIKVTMGGKVSHLPSIPLQIEKGSL